MHACVSVCTYIFEGMFGFRVVLVLAKLCPAVYEPQVRALELDFGPGIKEKPIFH